MIIGSNKAKNMIIQQGITPRLIQLLDDPIGGDDLKLEGKYITLSINVWQYLNLMEFSWSIVVIAVIGSLARGDENHIKSLTAAGVIPFLLNSNVLFFFFHVILLSSLFFFFYGRCLCINKSSSYLICPQSPATIISEWSHKDWPPICRFQTGATTVETHAPVSLQPNFSYFHFY